MRISDWSSDVCSSDLECDPQLCRSVRDIPRDRDILPARFGAAARMVVDEDERRGAEFERAFDHFADIDGRLVDRTLAREFVADQHVARVEVEDANALDVDRRSEEHTSELQSLMRISYAVFCL